MTDYIVIFVFVLSLYSIVRLTVYLVLSNWHSARDTNRTDNIYYRPRLTVIVPAHNEEVGIGRTLSSILSANYPKSRLEVIVADDGSTDSTPRIVASFIANYRGKARIRLISGRNQGKASALNNAIKSYATGQLIMCLDADSLIDKDCLKNSVRYFYKSNVVATASNVNIIENGTILGLAQRFEYLLSHHMKRANTVLGIEYIIGGVGSTFRRSMLKKVNFYDSDTLTEDIDLTLKIINTGNRDNRVIFAADAITYTEAVQTYGALVRQRYRWRYGRMQSFWKNRKLFFNTDYRYNRLLTFYLLPSTLLYEFLVVFEPIIIIAIILACIISGDFSMLISMFGLYTVIGLTCIWSSDHLGSNTKLRLAAHLPVLLPLMYILISVEYATSMKSFANLYRLRSSMNAHTTWSSPERKPDSV